MRRLHGGAHEFVRVSRKAEPNDLLNSAIACFGSGAILGQLQGSLFSTSCFHEFTFRSVSFSGGQAGATYYSIIFAVVGTTVDFATLKLKPALKSFRESMAGNNDGSQKQNGGLKFPEWSSIQILDEEALAAKKAREQLYAQRNVHNLTKEES
ncbi:hypothetical protein RHMOL_Rhmol01G0340000 [Rhododendron molle]|uniref:Uncharacterized protein n=1 Tax=Rhododendron molle TaxID=49168 RepID=A0ACC0Q8Z8_RHOML|nr:hypothetical protein RHMOL_Rhmol01G0340000 [Rhododendron molle]